MAAYGLYTHIQSNRHRSVALMIGLFAQVYVLVYAGALAAEALSYQASLQWLARKAWLDFLAAAPFATVGTLIWIAIAYRFNQAMIDAVTGASEVSRTEAPRLYNLLENLCISRGLPMPKLKIVEDDALNAFASGMNAKQYSVTVTTGLLARLDDAEIEGVLGHELTHIRNGDVRMMVVAMIIAGVIGFVAELIFRLWFNTGFGWRRRGSDDGDGDRGRGGNVVALVIAAGLVALAWLLSVLIRFALSRQREFLADAGAVELTKNPDAMISALRKIEGRGELAGATSAVMEMCVDNPREGFADLFATHPSVEARVDALVRFAGGHDPGPLALPQGEPEPSDQPADDANSPQGGPYPPQGGPYPPQGGPWGSALPPQSAPPAGGPWGPNPGSLPGQPGVDSGRPFLPDRPPVDIGGSETPPAPPRGPWNRE